MESYTLKNLPPNIFPEDNLHTESSKLQPTKLDRPFRGCLLLPVKIKSLQKVIYIEHENEVYMYLFNFMQIKLLFIWTKLFAQQLVLKQRYTGAHHQEPATTITSNSCHGVFPDRSIFSLDVPRIQIVTGTNLSNQLQSQARTNVDMST